MRDNPVNKKMEEVSVELRSAGESHFFVLFSDELEDTKLSYWANIGDDEACMVIETLVKHHGGEVLDRVIDKLIAEGEDLGFPEFVECSEPSTDAAKGGAPDEDKPN